MCRLSELVEAPVRYHLSRCLIFRVAPVQFNLGWFIFSAAAVFFAGSAYAQAPSSNLLEVVKASKGEEVQRLLDSGADAHVVGLDGSTTLLWASYQDDL